jgi:tetrahydromethanopterin S-methyltransferase subunit E
MLGPAVDLRIRQRHGYDAGRICTITMGGEGGEVTGVTFGKEGVVGVWVTGVVTPVMAGREGVVVVVGNEGWVVVGTVKVFWSMGLHFTYDILSIFHLISHQLPRA